ncbi:MAG: acyltransferase [Clostridia bacterium]|nr:acyltransferase [Clostridia bacterium]
MKKRKHELSLMNVILCMLVIFIHAASTAVTSADKTSLGYALLLPAWRLAACAVPGFIFLSAVKFALGAEKEGFSYGRYMLGRIKRVWIPYAIATIIYFVYFVLLNYMQPSAGEFFKLLLDGNMCGHFYFVVTIMQFYLLAPLWRVILKKVSEPVWAMLSVVAAVPLGWIFGQYLPDFIAIFYKGGIFPYADRVFTTYILWWMAGLIVGKHYEKVKDVLSRGWKGVMVLFIFAAVMNGGLSYLHFSGKTSIYWLETVHVFYIMCAVTFLFAITCRTAEVPVLSARPILFVDRASYSIYLWHPLFLYFGKALLGGKDVSLLTTFVVHLFFAFVVTITVCVGVSVMIGALKARIKR